MLKPIPSDGQQRVREIAQDLLNENQQLVSPEENELLQAELMERLSIDSKVTNDPITGCPVGYFEIAKCYAEWLTGKNWDELSFSEAQKQQFNFNRMVFCGSLGGKLGNRWHKPLFKGGAKPYSVAYSILCLQAGRNHSSEVMDVRYYVHSGITKIFEGNHRIAGYKLWGQVDFLPEIVTVFNDFLFNEEVNQALLRLENMFPKFAKKLLLGIKIPVVQRINELVTLYVTEPYLIQVVEKIYSEDITLDELNKVATAYDVLTNSPTKPIWEKLFSETKPSEEQISCWIHKGDGWNYKYPALDSSS